MHVQKYSKDVPFNPTLVSQVAVLLRLQLQRDYKVQAKISRCRTTWIRHLLGQMVHYVHGARNKCLIPRAGFLCHDFKVRLSFLKA
jgi:hypothetical protein